MQYGLRRVVVVIGIGLSVSACVRKVTHAPPASNLPMNLASDDSRGGTSGSNPQGQTGHSGTGATTNQVPHSDTDQAPALVRNQSLPVPAELASAGFVDLSAIEPSISTEMRYAGSYNFMGRPAAGYGVARCLLKQKVAEALQEVARDLKKDAATHFLKVYDCYRPDRAVKDFAAWSVTSVPEDEGTQKEFYPRTPKSELFAKGYIADSSTHSSGCTVDLTIASGSMPIPAEIPVSKDCASGDRNRDNGLDMGTNFDCFDLASHFAPPTGVTLSIQQKQNRETLRKVMMAHGFEPFEKEWWHCYLKGCDGSQRLDVAIE